MADFGICEKPDCQLSYRSLSLTSLFSRISAIKDMEKRKADVSGILPHLKPFALFFYCDYGVGRYLQLETRQTGVQALFPPPYS
jgi:hypothetical protein